MEQTQITKSGFSKQMVHNTDNVLAVDQQIHQQISGYYSSARSFTEGLKIRDWLAGRSFDEQSKFGIQILKKFGVVK